MRLGAIGIREVPVIGDIVSILTQPVRLGAMRNAGELIVLTDEVSILTQPVRLGAIGRADRDRVGERGFNPHPTSEVGCNANWSTELGRR